MKQKILDTKQQAAQNMEPQKKINEVILKTAPSLLPESFQSVAKEWGTQTELSSLTELKKQN